MEKGGGGSALNILSIFYTHHRIPNKHMMTINFDTITNNYEVIYVIKTVMKYYLKKIDDEFSSASSKYGSTFICWRHTWRDLVYEYSWAKSPMISGCNALDKVQDQLLKNMLCHRKISFILDDED